MNPVGPILTAELFPELRQRLLALLASLGDEEWRRPTAARLWNVKDVALHLLGGDIGNLSRRRDGFELPAPVESSPELVAFINQLNASWVAAGQRLSPRLLVELTEHVGRQTDEYFLSLDPFAPGGAVSWAGPQRAPEWLDVAREYTERWHHQQQIRDATGREGLYEERLFAPVIDTFLRALPHTFRGVDAPEGTQLELSLSGPGGGSWVLERRGLWTLFRGSAARPSALVSIASTDAWKVFTRGLRDREAMSRAEITGDPVLGAKVLETVSVIA
jgi:uncharacterized protein (TIGR03083 family)